MRLLLPHLAQVQIDDLAAVSGTLVISGRTSTDNAVPCPDCGQVTDRVHARYLRTLTDMAVGGRPVVIRLSVRRMICVNVACGRSTFAEQVDGLTYRHGRRSVLARATLQVIAQALAGRAGSRVARRLCITVSRSTLLRLLMGIVTAEPATPRVLGVDDFALKRSHVYATLLVDVETSTPIAVLPDRTSETFAAWLTAHPGVEVVCRDGSTAYANGARIGAPAAIQVSDRFHLWRSLGEAVEKTVLRNRASLREPTPTVQEVAPAAEPAPIPRTRMQARTIDRHAHVHRLLGEGASVSRMSRELDLDRKTVRKFASAAAAADLLNTRETVLDRFKAFLHKRFNEGVTNETALLNEIRERGFRGSLPTLRRYLHPFRATMTAPPAAPPVLKPRRVTRWIMTDPANLKPSENNRLQAILQRCPALRRTAVHVREFADMMKTLTGQHLPQWIKRVLADNLPDLRSFTTGLKRDLPAAIAGLTLPWSSGRVEGHVNRVKTIKKSMYGRAALALLTQRVLLPN